MIRVLVADDQALVRGGLVAILDAQDDIEVVGEAEDGGKAVDEALRLRPDVVLMDVRMPNVDGIEATKRLAAHAGAPRVLGAHHLRPGRVRLRVAARGRRRLPAQGRAARPPGGRRSAPSPRASRCSLRRSRAGWWSAS